MLHQDIASLDAQPLKPATRWLVPALVAAAAASGAIMFWMVGEPLFAGLFLMALLAMLVAGFAIERRAQRHPLILPAAEADLSLVSASLNMVEDAAALTDGEGGLLLVNERYSQLFGNGSSPIAKLESLQRTAIRDGQGFVDDIMLGERRFAVGIERLGGAELHLLWRLTPRETTDVISVAARRVAGLTGERLGTAGVLAVVIDADGRLIAANKAFADRALPAGSGPADDVRFHDLAMDLPDGLVRFTTEGEGASSLRVIGIPLDPVEVPGVQTLLMFDQQEGGSLASSTNVQALLEILPIGLALVDRDGRFLTMNRAFRVAGGIPGEGMPAYPGDLVIKEDKAAVADAVRRNARGPAMSGDFPVRLSHNPTEPVALTVAGLRGLGDATVLLLLKDNSEEAKLKRQVAQATKMQAVGQLAGGVAHDFNNILTAIIGHCDLMLMRHTPGDSDYDDIQQIKSNSNRAAGLTRQLLAFSRQQTLRPQVVQLPDVISEVSHLLKRLLGETVQLVVKHGRDLQPVRADPGQLEQVIVNLSVNARDAMLTKGGGRLTIQTYAVRADQVADLGSDILPIADYTALSINDSGTGIPASILSKVFEPFFTTKEVGKGTGLGLSTVYGIVKQSGGFIFADSKVGEGARFTIYLPVHQVEEGKPSGAAPALPEGDKELWGTGTVLLVEDEPMVRTVAERALTRHGYKVLTATNGEEALEVLAADTDEIAMMISDVVMPLMDGPTMVREARKTYPDIPILFMSGYAEEQLRNSIDLDNVAFLPKPFSVQELAEAVRRVLASAAGTEAK